MQQDPWELQCTVPPLFISFHVVPIQQQQFNGLLTYWHLFLLESDSLLKEALPLPGTKNKNKKSPLLIFYKKVCVTVMSFLVPPFPDVADCQNICV